MESLFFLVSTSVKISRDAKRLLDTLQARLVIVRGYKISLKELLDSMVRFSAEHEKELFNFISGVNLPLSPEEIEKLMSLPTDWGVDTGEEEIDSHLYGRKKETDECLHKRKCSFFPGNEKWE